MTIHYLNEKGRERFINGVTGLRYIEDALAVASMESGAELRLGAAGIREIFEEDTVTKSDVSGFRAPVISEAGRQKVEIWTFGVLHKDNPGPGGWSAVIRVNGKEELLQGSTKPTTRQRMELTAVIEALWSLEEPSDVTITTESKYILDSMTKGWLNKWEANGWKRDGNREVANADLWTELLGLLKRHNVMFCLE